MADGTLDSQVGARICNGLGIMRTCLETQKLEQLEAHTFTHRYVVEAPAQLSRDNGRRNIPYRRRPRRSTIAHQAMKAWFGAMSDVRGKSATAMSRTKKHARNGSNSRLPIAGRQCRISHAAAAGASRSWCAVHPRHGGENCGYTSFDQCWATIGAEGGWCRPNPFSGTPYGTGYTWSGPKR